MLEKNIDTVVLGCTHYPFVIPLIKQIVGENVRVIDPAPAVAKQVRRVLEAQGVKNESDAQGEVQHYTSGDPEKLKALLPTLLGEMGKAQKVSWLNDHTVTLATETQGHGD
jgi:glutamate racemase